MRFSDPLLDHSLMRLDGNSTESHWVVFVTKLKSGDIDERKSISQGLTTSGLGLVFAVWRVKY